MSKSPLIANRNKDPTAGQLVHGDECAAPRCSIAFVFFLPEPCFSYFCAERVGASTSRFGLMRGCAGNPDDSFADQHTQWRRPNQVCKLLLLQIRQPRRHLHDPISFTRYATVTSPLNGIPEDHRPTRVAPVPDRISQKERTAPL